MPSIFILSFHGVGHWIGPHFEMRWRKCYAMGYMFVLLAVSMAVSALGWIYFIYFFSVGYGFSIAALAVAMAALFFDVMTVPAAMVCAVMFVFGCRLGTYLLTREKRSEAYRKILYGPDASGRKPVWVIVTVWVFCALLYVCQVSPLAFYLANSKAGAPVHEAAVWAGAVLMVAGVALEAAADAQKTAAKKLRPKRFVDTGLYRFVRCPNYFGELVIWTGSFVICFGAACSLWQWIVAATGYVGIIYVMFSGARRLEMRQSEVYHDNIEYRLYARRTPLLIPFVPIYSLVRYRWLMA